MIRIPKLLKEKYFLRTVARFEREKKTLARLNLNGIY